MALKQKQQCTFHWQAFGFSVLASISGNPPASFPEHKSQSRPLCVLVKVRGKGKEQGFGNKLHLEEWSAQASFHPCFLSRVHAGDRRENGSKMQMECLRGGDAGGKISIRNTTFAKIVGVSAGSQKSPRVTPLCLWKIQDTQNQYIFVRITACSMKLALNQECL